MYSVTVVIPAYNEAERILGVVDAVQGAALVNQLLVVDDGSHDGTAELVEARGVRCLKFPENRGKGAAMRAGALAASGEILLFLDADLLGLTSAQVDAMICPVRAQQADMSVGIFRGGRASTDLAQRISPTLSGQRCLARDIFLSVPLLECSGFGVEVLLTAHARACNLSITTVILDGVTHPLKEEKRGLLHGIKARSTMYSDILTTLIRYQLATRFPGWASLANK